MATHPSHAAGDWLILTRDENVTIKDVDENDPSKGQGMFANKTLTTNDAVCNVSEPLLVALDTIRLRDTCYQCHSQPQTASRTNPTNAVGLFAASNTPTPAGLKLCTGCRVVRFCSAVCQRRSWEKAHKRECRMFSALSPRILPSPVRAVARLLLLDKAGVLSMDDRRKLQECTSHVDKIKSSQPREYMDLMLMAQAAIEYTKSDWDIQRVLEVFCRMKINSVTLMTPFFDPIGLAMHPFLAKMNHSCDPNAYIEFKMYETQNNGTNVQVVPIRTISKDEEITISYIEINNPYLIRQKELQTRYMFTCQCPECQKSQTNLPNEHIKLLQYNSTATKPIQFMTQAEECTTTEMTLSNLRYALHLILQPQPKIDSNIHHPRQPYPAILHKLILAYLDATQYNLVLALLAIEYFDVDPKLYPLPNHPNRVIHQYLFVQILRLVNTSRGRPAPMQSLDLDVYGLDMHFWTAHAIQKLLVVTGDSRASGAFAMIRAQIWEFGQEVLRHERLNDGGYFDEQMVRMQKLKDVVYAKMMDRNVYLTLR